MSVLTNSARGCRALWKKAGRVGWGGVAEIHDSGEDRSNPSVAIKPAALFDL